MCNKIKHQTASVAVNTKFRMFFTESSLKKAIETVYAEDQKQMFRDLLSILQTRNKDELMSALLDRAYSDHRDNRFYLNHFIEYFIFNKSIVDDEYNNGFRITLSSIKHDFTFENDDCITASFIMSKTFDYIDEYANRTDLISKVVSHNELFHQAQRMLESMDFNADTRSNAEFFVDEILITDVITKTFVKVKSANIDCTVNVSDVIVAVEDPNSLSDIKDALDERLDKLIHCDQVDFIKYYASIEHYDTYDTDLTDDDIEIVEEDTDELVS